MAASRILIVRLPCHKVFPTGPIYLMSAINRAAAGIVQHVLDLALLDRRRQAGALRQAIASFRPCLDGFFDLIGLGMRPDPIEPEIDLKAVEASFPQWEAWPRLRRSEAAAE